MSTPLLTCTAIHKHYLLGRTALPVLRGVDLTVESGSFTAITGASGSGKSTLLHVLSGLDVPQRGQVFYQGEPLFEPEGQRRLPLGRDSSFVDAEAAAVTPKTPHSAQRRSGEGPLSSRTTCGAGRGDGLSSNRRNRLLNTEFGFVFQFYHLLPEFDVLENVLLPCMVGSSVAAWLADRRLVSDRAHELLANVGLRDRMRHRPNELSGGERQRVAIARALVNRPKLLFADEPTGNLDRKTGQEVFGLLKALNQAGQTIVMVTHDRDLAQEADRVVNLVDGRVR